MKLNEFAELLCARKRRSISRGLLQKHKKLVLRSRKIQQGKPIRTHCRDMIILPEFAGKTFAIYNGKEFVKTDVTPEMVGYYLGEFVQTRNRVKHSAPGVGATKASKFVSLK